MQSASIRLRRRAKSMKAFFMAMVVIAMGLWMGATSHADSTGMIDVGGDHWAELPTYDYVDLSTDGAIEFWYRNGTDRKSELASIADTHFDDAYSVVLRGAVGKNFTFAVVIGPGAGSTAQASIGVVNDLSLLTQQHLPAKTLVPLSHSDGGNAVPIQLIKGDMHHIVLVQSALSKGIRVYLDGVLQGVCAGKFGKTDTLVLGSHAVIQPLIVPGKAVPLGAPLADEPFFSQSHFIGGIRVWRTGTFEESDMTRLLGFGRLTDIADLTTLPEYGYLAAYSDFTGDKPLLKFADPLAGGWFAEGAIIKPSDKASNVYVDFPIYTFVSQTTTELPAKLSDRKYNVFEDGNYIGTLALTPGKLDPQHQLWQFQHADAGWAPIPIDHSASKGEWFLNCTLGSLPKGKTFAGAGFGTVRLKRRTIVDLDIKSPAVGKLTPDEAKQDSQANPDKFLYVVQNFPKFFHVLYGSYNIVKMDPWNLFKPGLGTDDPVLREPAGQQFFKVDNSHQLILPFDLSVMQQQMGLDRSTCTLVTDATEYNSAVTNRIGAGFSGSLTVGTGVASPVQVSGTVNLNIAVQADTLKEMASQTSQTTEKILHTKWTQKYALLHRKEVLRLSDKYRAALRELYNQCATANTPDLQRRLIFAFFDKWGTHYPLGAVFGTMDMTETNVTDAMLTESSTNGTSFGVEINGGTTGSNSSQRNGNTHVTQNVSTIVRSLGDIGDNVPISLDLRPLHELLTPDEFPGEPQIYLQMRQLLAYGLSSYRSQELLNAVAQLPKDKQANGKKILDDLSKVDPTKPAPAPEPFDILALRYKGVTVQNDPYFFLKMPDVSLLMDGKIDLKSCVVYDGTFKPKTGTDSWVAAFEAANPSVNVVDWIAQNEQSRIIKTGTTIQPFGDPHATLLNVVVPRNKAVRDAVFVCVQCSCKIKGLADPTKPNGAILSSLSGTTPSPHDLIRYDFDRTAANLSGVGSGQALKTFDIQHNSRALDGGVLWADGDDLAVTENDFIGHPITFNYSLKKNRVDATGQSYIFQYPSNGQWRSGSASTPLVDGSGKNLALLDLVVHYEYAMLKNFKDAIQQAPSLLPTDIWGQFTAGVVEPTDYNPLANRSTQTPRLPPGSPISDTVLQELKQPPGGPLTLHSVTATVAVTPKTKGGPSSVEMALGASWFDKPQFVPANQNRHLWALVERNPGQWMMLDSDGRVLAADKSGAVITAAAADGDPSQVWFAQADPAAPDSYKFVNKSNEKFLKYSGDATAGVPVLADAGQPFRITPSMKLEPLPPTAIRTIIPTTVPPGWVKVACNAAYVAKFVVSYQSSAGPVSFDVTLPVGQSRQFTFPGDAKNIVVQGQYLNGVKYQPLFTKTYATPPNKTLTAEGSLIKATYSER